MESYFVQSAPGFFVDTAYQKILSDVGIDSLDSVFQYDQGENLGKPNLAAWRRRIRFQLSNGQTAYLKRYHNAPWSIQIKSWLQHGQRAFLSGYDKGPLAELQKVNVSIPQAIAYGGRWAELFEKKSFIIALEIPNALSLEARLPDCFIRSSSTGKREFIIKLADFIRRFHETGYRHRDLYLCHIFLSENKTLYLIDLHRTFRPKLLGKRYQVKDLAQLHYSSPADKVSNTDRLRFYLGYTQKKKLSSADKAFIRKIHSKAQRIARHDRKQGRIIPFEKRSGHE